MIRLAALLLLACPCLADVIQVSPTEIDFTALATYGTNYSGAGAVVYIDSPSIELDMTLRLFGCPTYDGTNYCLTDIQLGFGLSGPGVSTGSTIEEEFANGQFISGSGGPFNVVSNLQPGFYTIGLSVQSFYVGSDPGYSVIETGQLFGAVTLTPEPGSWILAGCGSPLCLLWRHHRLNRRRVNNVS